MAISMGMMSSGGPSSSSPWMAAGGRSSSVKGRGRVRCAAAAGITDQYRTLKIKPGATEMEVKKAFRQLALQYHPDVCKGRDCGVQFHQINEAYDIVINNLRATEAEEEQLVWSEEDLWEEWMGWEGAGIRDYTSHINPYI